VSESVEGDESATSVETVIDDVAEEKERETELEREGGDEKEGGQEGESIVARRASTVSAAVNAQVARAVVQQKLEKRCVGESLFRVVGGPKGEPVFVKAFHAAPRVSLVLPLPLHAPLRCTTCGESVDQFLLSSRSLPSWCSTGDRKLRLWADAEGFLVKVGAVRRSWKHRYFILGGSHLSYYATKEAMGKEPPLGVVHLGSNVRKVSSGTADPSTVSTQPEFQHHLSLVTTDRTWVFAASDVSERDLWLQALRSASRRPFSPFCSCCRQYIDFSLKKSRAEDGDGRRSAAHLLEVGTPKRRAPPAGDKSVYLFLVSGHLGVFANEADTKPGSLRPPLHLIHLHRADVRRVGTRQLDITQYFEVARQTARGDVSVTQDATLEPHTTSFLFELAVTDAASADKEAAAWHRALGVCIGSAPAKRRPLADGAAQPSSSSGSAISSKPAWARESYALAAANPKMAQGSMPTACERCHAVPPTAALEVHDESAYLCGQCSGVVKDVLREREAQGLPVSLADAGIGDAPRSRSKGGRSKGGSGTGGSGGGGSGRAGRRGGRDSRGEGKQRGGKKKGMTERPERPERTTAAAVVAAAGSGIGSSSGGSGVGSSASGGGSRRGGRELRKLKEAFGGGGGGGGDDDDGAAPSSAGGRERGGNRPRRGSETVVRIVPPESSAASVPALPSATGDDHEVDAPPPVPPSSTSDTHWYYVNAEGYQRPFPPEVARVLEKAWRRKDYWREIEVTSDAYVVMHGPNDVRVFKRGAPDTLGVIVEREWDGGVRRANPFPSGPPPSSAEQAERTSRIRPEDLVQGRQSLRRRSGGGAGAGSRRGGSSLSTTAATPASPRQSGTGLANVLPGETVPVRLSTQRRKLPVPTALEVRYVSVAMDVITGL